MRGGGDVDDGAGAGGEVLDPASAREYRLERDQLALSSHRRGERGNREGIETEQPHGALRRRHRRVVDGDAGDRERVDAGGDAHRPERHRLVWLVRQGRQDRMGPASTGNANELSPETARRGAQLRHDDAGVGLDIEPVDGERLQHHGGSEGSLRQPHRVESSPQVRTERVDVDDPSVGDRRLHAGRVHVSTGR